MSKLVGVNASVTLQRTLYIEVDDNEDAIEKAKKEIILPDKALFEASKVLSMAKIRIPNLDLKDWNIIDENYTIINNENT